MPKTQHILVIRLSAMGDVAMTVPILRALIAQHPNTKITMLSKGHLAPVFEPLKSVSFFEADVQGKHKGFLGLWKLFRQLQREDITHIADLHNVLRSKVLRFFFNLSGIKVAHVDKGREEKKALTRVNNKIFKPLKTTFQRYSDVFNSLGFPVDISTPIAIEKKELSDKIKSITGKRTTKKWLGVAPFAQYDSKTYPLDLMEEVLKNLSLHYQLFLFGGGKKEIDILTKIEKNFPHTICIAGKMNLSEELELIANLDLMLAMDSSNAHFAAMQQIKTITIWGVTHPYAGFAPFNQPADYCILPDLKCYPNIPCSVYGNKVCAGYESAMRSIDPATIVQKIIDVLTDN
uniref:glycosyltransferase family 9 protein n=1 Tax=Polaribacter sp. TaxID=1920175 RepID=UPI004048C81E